MFKKLQDYLLRYNHRLLAKKVNRTEHEDRLLEAWDRRGNL